MKYKIKAFCMVLCVVGVMLLLCSMKGFNSNNDNINDSKQEEPVKYDTVEEVYLNKDERNQELQYYESLYETCVYRIDNEPMNEYLAEDIRSTISYRIPELATLNIEDKYKDDLLDALTGIMISMKEYKKGNLDKSVEWVDKAENKYNSYKKIMENS